MNSSKTALASHRKRSAQANVRSRVRYGKNASLLSFVIQSCASLLRTPPNKATLLICALTLILPITFALFSSSFKSAEENLLLNRQITVFLDSQLTEGEANLFATNLATNLKVQSSVVAAMNIQNNKLLTVVIQPSTDVDDTDMEHIVQELNSHPSVDFVDADVSWLDENLQAIKTTKKMGILSVVLTALVTSILAYAFTYTDLLRHQTDYRTLNQLGASHSTALKPFILRSLLLATVAVSASILIVWGLIAFFAHYLVDISTYKGIFPTSMPIAYLLLLGIVASLSSVMAVLLKGKKIYNSFISIA